MEQPGLTTGLFPFVPELEPAAWKVARHRPPGPPAPPPLDVEDVAHAKRLVDLPCMQMLIGRACGVNRFGISSLSPRSSSSRALFRKRTDYACGLRQTAGRSRFSRPSREWALALTHRRALALGQTGPGYWSGEVVIHDRGNRRSDGQDEGFHLVLA